MDAQEEALTEQHPFLSVPRKTSYQMPPNFLNLLGSCRLPQTALQNDHEKPPAEVDDLSS